MMLNSYYEAPARKWLCSVSAISARALHWLRPRNRRLPESRVQAVRDGAATPHQATAAGVSDLSVADIVKMPENWEDKKNRG